MNGAFRLERTPRVGGLTYVECLVIPAPPQISRYRASG